MAKRAFYKLLRVQEVDSPLQCERTIEGSLNLHKTTQKPKHLDIFVSELLNRILRRRSSCSPHLSVIMDSSPVLRLQSQSKIRSDFQRMKNEHNKMPAQKKPCKPKSAPHLPDHNTENQDPENSQKGKKTPVRPGGSRLPVLAKSLRLQTPSDFSQSHCRWEEKPLAGKTKKKRPCTRPIPFNFSQPKSLRLASENQQPLILSQTRTGTHPVQPDNSACNARLKTQNINDKSTKHPATLNSNVDSSTGTGKSMGKAADNTPHLPGQSVSSITFKTSAVSNNVLHQDHSSTSSVQSSLSTEACLDNMNQLSLKESTKFSQACQNMPLKSSTEKVENFQTNHAALLSILRNEGLSAAGLGSTTPQSKPYNYAPQRVSVMMSRQKPGAPTGPVRPMQFSPDPAALHSILQNEGVKAGGPVGTTPQNPVRPSGRGTSIFTAQRVPVRKNQSEAAGGPVAVALKETPQKKWTPQRVRDTRHQPMSAMKWHLSTQQSPYGNTPGLRSFKTNLQPRQEEVVQRLFDDTEGQYRENVMEKDPETQTEQLLVQVETEGSDLKNNTRCERKVGTSKDDNDDEKKEQEHRIVGRQPFFQAPQRESVIFFSTGKKLLRAPRFEKQESSVHQEQLSPVSPEQTKMLPVHEDKSSVPEPTCHIIPAVQSLHRDLIVQKTCSKSPAVALLRKRLPQLEELRLDEEVATYTSVTVQAAPGFLPPRPRCGNPVASFLHFEEFSRFVPISCGLSSGSSSPESSPLHER
ncbi:uncharacterized protein troap [Notolabrus celidotus]|uniref:uncharacterized protein troap n=1 Tax=Notolabrus celidotus TaxID=1203425 RepID=UPI00148F6F1D|nr:uncharacterized protein troap [Notolabrus celidotus]